MKGDNSLTRPEVSAQRQRYRALTGTRPYNIGNCAFIAIDNAVVLTYSARRAIIINTSEQLGGLGMQESPREWGYFFR